MEMSPDLETAFNHQIALELESSQAYLQMAAHAARAGLSGMSTWMRHQAEEEREHALRFFDFVLARGNRVVIEPLPAPAADFDSPADVFAAALEHERRVSTAIAKLHHLAAEEHDVFSFPLLQAFLDEQIEEEATVSGILDRLRMIGADGAALLVIDEDLGRRGEE